MLMINIQVKNNMNPFENYDETDENSQDKIFFLYL